MKVMRLVFILSLLVLLCGQAHSATGTIGWAKTLPDDTVLPKPIVGVVSTIVSDPLLGYVSYVEDINRISGIIVDSQGVTGQIVQVTGTIKSKASGERYISGSILSPTGPGQVVSPLAMNNKFAASKSGLDTDGIMATVLGSVTNKGYDDYGNPYVYIDDGSGLKDGTVDSTGNQNIGLRVKTTYPEYFEIGDYWGITGPIGKDASSDGAKSFKVVQECLTFPELSAPVAYALGGNGQIYVNWDGDPCAGGYRIYRSNTETGPYSLVGESTAIDLTYLDKPLSNGVTYWYVVTSISGKYEGPASVPVSATTVIAAPVVSIDTINVDQDGILDITFSCAPGTGGTAIPMVSLDIDGAELWDDAPSGLSGSWCYDTTELTVGTHTVGVKVISSDSVTGDRYLGYDKKTFVVNNDISNLYVSEIADGTTPFEATFRNDCSWTITVRQGDSVLAQQSGTGREVSWLWDASTGYEGNAEVELSYTPVTQAMSASSNGIAASAASTKSKFSTFWITSKSLLARPGHYQWAAWYARDQKLDASGAWYWANKYFSSQFNQPFENGYSMQLLYPSQFDSVVLTDLEMTDEPAKVSHVVWSGHGNFGLDRYNLRPNVLQANSWMANFVGQGDWWHGISPFRDYLDSGMKWKLTGLGPKIGNRAAWKKAGKGRGRPEITQLNRRFKFAVVFGCWSARGTMALALGIPKKQIKGCKCCYIGFNNMLWSPSPSSDFSYYLFDALKRGQTTGASVNYASRAFATVTGDAAKSNPRLFGDPDMTIGRTAP